MGKRRIRIIWHGFKGRRKVRDSGAIALKNLGNSVLEEQRRQRKTGGERDELAPGIIKEIKRWFAKQFSKMCHCGFWRRNRVEIFDPDYQLQSTAIPDVPSSSGQSSDPVCVYTAENSPRWQQETNLDYDDYNDDENFHQKFNHSMTQLPKIRKMRHAVKQMKENSERILKIEKDFDCSPTPIHRNIMQDVNLPGMLVDDHVEFKIGERDENDDVKKLRHSPAVTSSSVMPGFFFPPRPIGFWCPLNITFDTAQNIIMEFPKCRIPTLFEAMTAAERYCGRLRTVKLEEHIETVNIQNLTESIIQDTDFIITTTHTDQENHTFVVNIEPNASAELKNAVGISNNTEETQEQEAEFHKDLERCHNATNSLSSSAAFTWNLSEKAEEKLKCEGNVGVSSSEDSKLTDASISLKSFSQPSSLHFPIPRLPVQSEQKGIDQPRYENQNRDISSKESTEDTNLQDKDSTMVHKLQPIQNDAIYPKITEPVTNDEIADMIREIENNMDGRDSA